MDSLVVIFWRQFYFDNLEDVRRAYRIIQPSMDGPFDLDDAICHVLTGTGLTYGYNVHDVGLAIEIHREITGPMPARRKTG
jgi:hypothetical protein